MFRKIMITMGLFSLLFTMIKGADNNLIELPEPNKTGGMPLMKALNNRHTSRSFKDDELPRQMLSDLLWAAFGINRPQSGKRTAPSAMNMQEIDVYVCSKEGAFLYNAEKHALKKITDEDIRKFTGTQNFVDDAPLNLVFVADYNKMGNMDSETKLKYSWCDAGYISQNVYLYCASEGLANVVRAMIDRDKLHPKMKLDDSQKIVLSQTVGYPK
ncbi:MAG: SagB/ThcOx family dehydrogenase [Candidatus Marinimicrobia bacterium]|nr:SagB/ThcOx family dehydrogenase [Candidatus Neomarinimicrobiota bacterium]